MTSVAESGSDYRIVEVAVPVPLRQTFDFLCPLELGNPIQFGRVKVPFGSRKLLGQIVTVKTTSDLPLSRLKPILELLDDEPVFDDLSWKILSWLSRYYLAPIGEVLEVALPVALRQGKELSPQAEKVWRLTEHGRSSSLDELNRAPLQLAIIKRFMGQSVLSSSEFKEQSDAWHSPVKSLVQKGWLEEFSRHPRLEKSNKTSKREIVLTEEQAHAATRLNELSDRDEFSCTLLQGVTGSGKTEVYFEVMESVLERDKSILILVPEIGLTPQLITRIEQRFSLPLVTLHSGLNDTQRHNAWWHARRGEAKIVLGTRSAIFTQMPELGLIIIDEEHDASFKQHDGVRYHARDLAVYRAKLENIPIVLGSATPSLESFRNGLEGRYQHIKLTHRASSVALPKVELFDLNKLPTADGLSPAMSEAIRFTLDKGKQALLYINRRGFAPVHYCSACKAAATCHRCDSFLTVHQRANRLRCHHCGYEGVLKSDCSSCKTEGSMVGVGDGTQRVEDAVSERFSNAKILRIDRDTTRRKGELENSLELAKSGEVDIILGTQLITKGHDFPNIGMVGILECDSALYSSDFRSTEHLFSQLVQVAGRSGRRDDVGRVFVQTRFQEHPIFDYIRRHDYDGFVAEILKQRAAANFPPFGHLILLRAESPHQAKALQFLRRAKAFIGSPEGVLVMDAVPAPMERRAGRYRAQLLLHSSQRSTLNHAVSLWLHHLANDSQAKKLASSVRWSVDVDPMDLY